MSKKAEIKAILRDGSGDRQFSLHCSDYETVATEIEKLFEVEGDVEKIADQLVKANIDIGYGDYVGHGEYHSYKKALTKKQIIKIIKRTITDKIIEE